MTALTVTGFAVTALTVDFGVALPVLTETACAGAAAFGTSTAAGFAEAEGAVAVFTPETDFGDELAGFAVFADCTESAVVCDADGADLPATAAFTGTAFVCDFAGAALAADAFACTETAFALAAATLAALIFAPLGEGLLPCAVAGFTLTDAGCGGFCPAVGFCANAAAERTMSMPSFRIIYVLPLAVAGVAAG